MTKEQLNDGGSAFPSHCSMGGRAELGMSLRDYFAAKAMQELICNHYEGDREAQICMVAYRLADAMLEARNHD